MNDATQPRNGNNESPQEDEPFVLETLSNFIEDEKEMDEDDLFRHQVAKILQETNRKLVLNSFVGEKPPQRNKMLQRTASSELGFMKSTYESLVDPVVSTSYDRPLSSNMLIKGD